MVLGRAKDGSVGIDLRDKTGRTRIQLHVANDGTPSLQFFDSSGKLTKEFNVSKE
jgi:hypothetical protein